MVIVESGWGSILPTVIIANMMHAGPAERSGRLNIGDQIMSINGTSLVGLPLSTCQSIIKVRPQLPGVASSSHRWMSCWMSHRIRDPKPCSCPSTAFDTNPSLFQTPWLPGPLFFSVLLQGLKNQSRIKLNIVRCPPVTTVLIRRPDLRYQLGFSVQNGIVGSPAPTPTLLPVELWAGSDSMCSLHRSAA